MQTNDGTSDSLPKATPAKMVRPMREVFARLRSIYGDRPVTGENAVLAARRTERY